MPHTEYIRLIEPDSTQQPNGLGWIATMKLATTDVDTTITQLPGMGRRDQVSLNQFVRPGLEKLSNMSWIRSHKRITEREGKTCEMGYDHEAVCAACNKTIFEFTPGLDIASPYSDTLEYVRIVFTANGLTGRRNAKWFCFDCATDRNAMIAAIQKDKRFKVACTATVATDKQDVYAFIAQTITEDRMEKLGDADLRLLQGVEAKVGSKAGVWFGNVIGGRILYQETINVSRQESEAAKVARVHARVLAKMAADAEKEKAGKEEKAS